ncbi:MAG: cation:proton antiporter [Acidimicrobiales bacterium]
MLFDHPEELELLAAFGLIFLLFYLGVEFSVEDLTSGGGRLLASAGIYLGLNVGGGLLLGLALGWGTSEALIVAGATGISSSAIVTKLLVELHRLANPETRLILGIIVIEDLFLALYLAALAPVLGQADSAADGALLFARALAFLLALAAVARWGGPLVGRVVSAKGDELLVVLFVGFALLVAGLAYELGVSDAIGAFMAGLVLAGTAAATRIERLVRPLRARVRRAVLLRLRPVDRPRRDRLGARPGSGGHRLDAGAHDDRRHRRRPDQPPGSAGRGQRGLLGGGPRRVRPDPRDAGRRRRARLRAWRRSWPSTCWCWHW